MNQRGRSACTSEAHGRSAAYAGGIGGAIVALLALTLVTSCGTSEPATGGGSATEIVYDCERLDYPCYYEDVAPEVRALEVDYLREIAGLFADSSTSAEVLDWILQQDKVVAAEAAPDGVYFRLEGGRPSWYYHSPLVPVAPPPPPADHMAGVVGDGTERDNPQNRKSALFLMPFLFEHAERDLQTEYLLEPKEWMQATRDYQTRVTQRVNAAVTPDTFRSWHGFDAIFVHTHGSVFDGGTFIATGITRPYDPQKTDDANDPKKICDELIASYLTFTDASGKSVKARGIECGTIDVQVYDYDSEQWSAVPHRTVGLLTDWFKQAYPNGLEKALVLLSGCSTLSSQTTVPRDLGKQLAGNSSVYFGWTDSPTPYRSGPTVQQVLERLIKLNEPAETALAHVCNSAAACGGPAWGEGYGTSPYLDIEGSDEAKKLRLQDLPTLTHPTSLTPVEGGASLRIQGTAGDGQDDELNIAVHVIGVVDPAGGGIGSAAAVHAVGAPERYTLRLFVDDLAVAQENLARPDPARAHVMSLDSTTFWMQITVPLGFDVPEAGRDATLRVDVVLPEGGTSSHEVEVALTGAPVCSFSATVSGPLTNFAGTYEGHASDLGFVGVSAVDSPWGAQFLLRQEHRRVGVHGDVEVHALAYELEDPENPGNYFHWYANGLGTATITRVEEELIEGSLSAPGLLWNGDGDFDTPLDVEITFRAVPYDIGHDSPYRACREYWGEPLP